LSGNGNRVVFGLSSGDLLILDEPYNGTTAPYIASLPLLGPTTTFRPASELMTEDNTDFEPPFEDSVLRSPESQHHGVIKLAVSHSGGRVAAATHDGRVTIWEDGPHPQWVTGVGTSTITNIVMSDDETLISVGTEDGSVTLLRVADGRILGHWGSAEDSTTKQPWHEVFFLRIDIVNNRIACGTYAGCLRWLNIDTGDWTFIGRVRFLEDFSSLLVTTSDPCFRLQRDDFDIAVVSPKTVQPVAWIPCEKHNLQIGVADRMATSVVTLGGNARFYVQESAPSS